MRTIAIAVALLCSSSVFAVDFGFEDQTVGVVSGPVFVTEGGITLSVTSDDGYVAFLDSEISEYGSISVLGKKTETLGLNLWSPTIYKFDREIISATLVAGDDGGDDDGDFVVELLDQFGAVTGTIQQNYGTSNTGTSIFLNNFWGARIYSTSPSNNLNSFGSEWRDVEAVPEPMTLALLAFVPAFIRRRKK